MVTAAGVVAAARVVAVDWFNDTGADGERHSGRQDQVAEMGINVSHT